MITNLQVTDSQIALSFKGQFLIITVSNAERSQRGYFYEIKLVIGISNEQERIQFTFSDFILDETAFRMKWTQSFYLAPYFFGVLATNINKAVITIDDRVKNVNEIVNSLIIKFNPS
jgi:hypothetical protein